MNVMNNPVDLRAHDDHLKHLLDQRAARADLHGRFPSLSEFSDSPSLYSHPHFSPRPPDRPFLDHSFRYPQSPNPYTPFPSEPRSPISDRERLNIPNASSLDLEDDPRSSSELNSIHDPDLDSPHEGEEEEIPRISMYGPKMRFHSPAPWEEDDADAKSIVEEPSKRPKKKDSGKKGWSLSKSNGETRPSTESSRSGGKSKQSLDAPSTNGTLAALAHASMSSTSLAITQSSPQALRDKLSLPRLRSRTPSSYVGHVDTYSPNNTSPVSRISTPPHSDMYGDDRSLLGHSSTRSETPQYEYTHPYANPDLVRNASHDVLPPPSPHHHLTFGAIRSDSNATLTDTTPSSSFSQFRSTTTLGMSPGTSTTSMNPSLNESTSSNRFTLKGISSPMPVNKASLHPDTLTKLNGFQQSPVSQNPGLSPHSPITRRDNPQSVGTMGGLNTWDNGGSTLKLISLEEAQAQLRERTRSATANPAFTSPFPNPPMMEEPDMLQRAPMRARSSSAGGKGRHSDATQRHGPMGDSPVHGPGKQVVKKKSGFLRLFNGKDRVSPSSPPPPVPLFATDAFAANPPPTPQHYSRPRQGSSHRVPVPSLSPSLMGEHDGSNGSSSGSSPPLSSTGSSVSSGMQQQQHSHLSARRKVPELSIVTSSSLVNLSVKAPPYTAPLSAGLNDVTQHHMTPTMPASRDAPPPSPSSAPSCKSDFVGLSIRPMSTLFTRELKELAVTDNPSLRTRPSLDVDTGTPTTATTAISPLSPDFPTTKALPYERSSEEKSSPFAISPHDRDQSSVIQALQEQILTARRAWQRQIWELEGQVRDLKGEVEELRNAESSSEFCAACGRGCVGRPGSDDASNGKTLEELKKAGVKVGGIVNRPRARTGVGSRFASGT